jgi:pimeloyl-ACP methyl ester carboxylesterase
MLNTILHGEKTDKPDLVVAHGLFGSARNWGAICKRLSDRGRIIAVDMRNHGASPWYPSQTYADMAADLALVIDGRADVLGHSMGGKAAMLLALTHPQKVNKLIVADIAPVSYDRTQSDKIAVMRGVDFARVSSRADAAAQMQGLEPGLADFFLQSIDLKERKWRLNLDALADNMPAIMAFPDVDGVFEGPVLFLTGAQSDYVLPEHRQRIKALFPNAVFAKIPGAGHWLHAEKPREFEAAVRTFLG